MIRKVIFTSVLFLCLSSIVGQGFYNRNAWHKMRKEISFGLGASNFLGDLGGRNLTGSDFIWDTELSKTRYVAHFDFMYYLARKIGLKASFHYAKIGGDDKLTTETFRNNRNLNFESNIFEGSLALEVQFKKEAPGNRYNLKSKTGKKLGLKSFALGIYGTAGIGLFYFNPKAIAPDGSKVALKPLHTEGQGMTAIDPFYGEITGPEEYKGYSIAIPLGIGFRKSLNRYWGWKFEVSHRFTFTDYIDDVSGVYFNNQAIEDTHGAQAAYFADPNTGLFGPVPDGTNGWGQTHPNYTNQQRGDASDKDGYMFVKFSIYKKILSTPKRKRRKSVRRVKASF